MEIENIALVRATDIIPIDGIIVPVSESKYIKKNTNEPFAVGIKGLLKRKGIITPIDFSKLEDENTWKIKIKK